MTTRYEDGDYLQENPDWHAADSPWKASQVLALLRRNGVAPRAVCDVGCGAGRVLEFVSDGLGPTVVCTGYDVSPQAHVLAKRRERAQLSFVQGNVLEQLDGADAPRFDMAMALDVFEHVDDYIGFLRKMRPLAHDKVFHVPLDLSAQMVLRREPLRRVRRVVGHLHYFTKDTALDTLEHAGYKIVDYRYTSHFDLPGHRHWRQWLLALPRKLLFAANPDLAVRMLGGYSLLVLAR